MLMGSRQLSQLVKFVQHPILNAAVAHGRPAGLHQLPPMREAPLCVGGGRPAAVGGADDGHQLGPLPLPWCYSAILKDRGRRWSESGRHSALRGRTRVDTKFDRGDPALIPGRDRSLPGKTLVLIW